MKTALSILVALVLAAVLTYATTSDCSGMKYAAGCVTCHTENIAWQVDHQLMTLQEGVNALRDILPACQQLPSCPIPCLTCNEFCNAANCNACCGSCG